MKKGEQAFFIFSPETCGHPEYGFLAGLATLQCPKVPVRPLELKETPAGKFVRLVAIGCESRQAWVPLKHVELPPNHNLICRRC